MPLPGAFRFEMFPEVIATPRLRLRRPLSGDESLCERMFFAAYESSVEPATTQYARAFGAFMVEHWTRYGFGFYVLATAGGAGDGDVVGHVGLKYRDCGAGTWGATSDAIELGFALVPGAQGRGYASEAGRAVINAAFEGGLTSILGRCLTENVRSAATLVRCGMTEIASTQRFRHFEVRSNPQHEVAGT